jgi:hypothetical protein
VSAFEHVIVLPSFVHALALTHLAPVVFEDKRDDPVTLERYCDDHWGFVRLEVTKELVAGRCD